MKKNKINIKDGDMIKKIKLLILIKFMMMMKFLFKLIQILLKKELEMKIKNFINLVI